MNRPIKVPYTRSRATGAISALATVGSIFLAMQANAAELSVTNAAARTGASGLEVTPSTSCTGSDTEVFNNLTVTGVEFFEACNTLAADSNFVVGSTGDATITAGQRIVFGNGFRVASGGSLTARIDRDFSPLAFVQDNSPTSETTYNLEFYVNLDGLSLNGGDEIEHFTAHAANNVAHVKLLVRQGAGPELVLAVLENNGTRTESAPVSLQAGWNKVSMNWTAAANASPSIAVNNGTPATLSGLDTSTRRIDFVRWGVISGVFTKNPGVIFQDDFISER